MVEESRLDYIYDYINLDNADLARLNNALCERELSRLEYLAHLGLVGKTYRLARHNKLEHAYGTYWLSKICLENTRGLVHNKAAFRLAAILHGIGHLPFSYDTEYAVAKLYMMHGETRSWLDGLFDTVVAFANQDTIELEARNMKSNLDYARLHSWFAAYKVAMSESNEFKNDLGKSIVHAWLDTDSIDNQLFKELDKIDYVLRDMHYAALGRIELNFVPILKQFTKDSSNQLARPSIIDFIEATHDYLCNELYFTCEQRYLSQILEKTLVGEIVRGTIHVEELLGKTDSELENSFVRPDTGEIVPVLSNAVGNIERGQYWQVCSIVCDCKDKSIIEIERNLAGTNLSAIHRYSQAKGIYIQAMPKPYYKDSPQYEWTSSGVSVCIDYDFGSGHPKHAIGALVLAERWAPENMYGIELTCREEALRFLTGLDVEPHFDRYENVVEHIISRHMPDPEGEWDPKLFHGTWKLGKQRDTIEELFYTYGISWPVKHFLVFPEHWSTEIVRSILQDVDSSIARPRRRRSENDADYQARKDKLLEYSYYLKSILQIRENGVGWVLPSLWLLKGDGKQEAEIDVVSIYVRRPYAGPVTLELREASTNTSIDNQENNRRKLNKILQRVKVRFGKKVRVSGFFNDNLLFEWPR